MRYELRPIGFVKSSFENLEDRPDLGSEWGPEAWIELDPSYAEGHAGMKPGGGSKVR